MKLLVTGGAGYIGSHLVAELAAAGHQPVVVDNLSNASPRALERVATIVDQPIPLQVFDVADRWRLRRLFQAESFDAVFHLAGLKSAAESVAEPLAYYQTNIESTLSLCQVMSQCGVKRLIFSSSATVYGQPTRVPIKESAPLQPVNPYGQTKAMIEQILSDLAQAGQGWRIAALRYFNPVGAHPSGLIGEDPSAPPANLLPAIAQVASGRRPRLSVFGGDYPTADGTAIRDYIHVVDLASGHLAALKYLPPANSFLARNLGNGQGTSVLEAIETFRRVSNQAIPYRISRRRPGDVAICYADVALAKQTLRWQAAKTLADACADAWRWQSRNPQGYRQPQGRHIKTALA